MAGTLPPAGPDGTSADPAGWAADVDALLAERARAGERGPVALIPGQGRGLAARQGRGRG